MPSSIFSSERAPKGGIGATIGIAVLCAILLLAGIEVFLRSNDGRTNLPLSKSRYADNLEKGLANPDRRTTLLLGASRVRSGFSSAAFAKRYGNAPLYYLATPGESPLALLTYLADRSAFSGYLIVALSGEFMSGNAYLQQDYVVNYYEDEWNLNQKINHRTGDWISGNLVLRQEVYSIANIIRTTLTETALPPVPYWRRNEATGESFYDFSRVRDLSLLAPPRRVSTSLEHPDPGWKANRSRLQKAVSGLTARGAKIALVRLPTSGNRWLNENTRWPREKYWNRISSPAGVVKLHFQDVDVIGRFDQPDWSHIDERDKAAFTSALLTALESRGMTWDKP